MSKYVGTPEESREKKSTLLSSDFFYVKKNQGDCTCLGIMRITSFSFTVLWISLNIFINEQIKSSNQDQGGKIDVTL